VESPDLIGVDWGASRLRAYRFGKSGSIVDTRERQIRLEEAADLGFESVLAELTLGWTGGAAKRLLLCGMVGSRNGWREAPYVPCPASISDLAENLTRQNTALGEVAIAAGVKFETSDRVDVMRGEETQILGAIREGWEGVVVAPGTHSKWVRFAGGRIVGFRTWMTGELFDLLRRDSLLASLMSEPAHDQTAFADGVARAMEDRAITSLLFAARAEWLLGRRTLTEISALVSGLLIGAEVIAGLADLGDAPLALVGRKDLTDLYALALTMADRRADFVIEGGIAAAKGLWRVDEMHRKRST
jgi:2-dehydro-3-deoxygalactonokinase